MTATLAENFDQHFEIKLADSELLKRESYKIRHTVYAEELGWEPIHPKGIEIDECDPYASSLLLVHKRTGTYAGTVRVVIPPISSPENKLPFELYSAETVHKEVVDPNQIPRGSFGEISRLAVPNTFRRRSNEKNRPFIIDNAPGGDYFSVEERRNFPNIAIGLYLSAISMVNMCNHTHLFVVMEPRLKKILQKLGLNFRQCGDKFDHRGVRALFCLERKDFTSQLGSEILELYNLLERQLVEQLILYPYRA